MNLSPHFAVVEATRGTLVESRHGVDIVVARADGSLVSVRGAADRLVFPRSAIKALQAIPLVESGAADAYGFEPRHIALACASHQGEEMHVLAASQMLERTGIDQTCLECGAHLPARQTDREKLARRGRGAEPVHNNCSGKHAGFLAFARHANLPLEGYVKIDHPVQRQIASVLEAFTGIKHDTGNHGIDGCSIPTYAVPLDRLAIAYAKFGVAKCDSPERAAAMVRIRDACFAHPEMVAGTDAMDSEIMTALSGRAFVKTGAEGVYVASLPERGLGIALKCHDGATRASQVAIAATLESLLELDEDESSILKRFANPQLHNWNNIHVGELRMAKGDN